MKLRGLSKDRTAKVFELGELKFWIKPADMNMRSAFEGRARAGLTEVFSSDIKRYFAKTHLTDWEGLIDDETGKQVEYSIETAVEIMTDESLDDLFFECFNFSYTLAVRNDDKTTKDAETAAKKSDSSSTKASNRKSSKTS